jgi:hypothetical protein
VLSAKFLVNPPKLRDVMLYRKTTTLEDVRQILKVKFDERVHYLPFDAVPEEQHEAVWHSRDDVVNFGIDANTSFATRHAVLEAWRDAVGT